MAYPRTDALKHSCNVL